jgi:RNA polymerase sigma factor (sigma-70 family)
MIAIEDVLKNPALKDQFIEENQKLVTMVLRKNFPYTLKTDAFDDYFQVGSIGLLKATQNFKPEFGYAFSTYAVPMILGQIQRYRRDYDTSLIKVSRSSKDIYFRYLQLKDIGRSDKEICEELNVEINKLNQIINSMHHPSSTDQSIDEEKDIPYINLLSDGYNLEEDVLSRISVKEKLLTLQAYLNEKEWQIFILSLKGKTQGEVANRIKMSQAHVSRILLKIKNIYKQFEQEDKFMSLKIDLTTEQLMEDCKQYGTDTDAAQKIAEKHGLNTKQIINLIMNRGIKKLMDRGNTATNTENNCRSQPSKQTKIENIDVTEKPIKGWMEDKLKKKSKLILKSLKSPILDFEYELDNNGVKIYCPDGLCMDVKHTNLDIFIEELQEISEKQKAV